MKTYETPPRVDPERWTAISEWMLSWPDRLTQDDMNNISWLYTEVAYHARTSATFQKGIGRSHEREDKAKARVKELEVELERLQGIETEALDATSGFSQILADNRRLEAEVERLTAERDAYKRAKAENDERFMLERDEARAEAARLRRTVAEAEAALRDAVLDV